MIQDRLLDACNDLQNRDQVAECMQDMLIDLELEYMLAERLKSKQTMERLQRTVDEQRVALAEARALREQGIANQSQMADTLLDEMIQLSKEIGEMEEMKQQHEQLLMQYDELVAKLMQTEDRLEEARTREPPANDTEQSQERTPPLRTKSSTLSDEGSQPMTDDVRDDNSLLKQTINDDTSTLARGSAEVVDDAPATEATTKGDPPEVLAEPVETDTNTEPDKTHNESSDQEAEKEDIHEITEAIQEVVTPEIQSIGEDDADETERVENKNATEVESPTQTEGNEADNEGEENGDEGAAVVLIEDDEFVTPKLDEFETEVLMKIFAFLDALEILNTAQISSKMYSRVDTLFGFGDDSQHPQEDNSTIATNETPAFQPTVVALPPEPTKAPTSAASQPTVAAIPERKHATPAASATAFTTPTTKPASANLLPKNPLDHTRNLFSMLGPRRQQQQQTPKKPLPKEESITPGIRESDLTSSPPAPLPMNAAMANSMAAKLSDAELNAIILMTDRLKQNETLARKLAKEKEDLVAKLEGTERVKQFLVNKVRDMEVAISSSVENEAKVAQQIASDQEVIAFLDGRVHELENEAIGLRAAQRESVDGLEKVKEQSAQKASVMGDMLQFEREKLKESEREWKATKKLLVKEVKSCRAQITALQAERDGYREQNERLQKAVMRNQNGSSSLMKHNFG